MDDQATKELRALKGTLVAVAGAASLPLNAFLAAIATAANEEGALLRVIGWFGILVSLALIFIGFTILFPIQTAQHTNTNPTAEDGLE